MERIHVEDHPLSSSWNTNNPTLHTANSTDDCSHDSYRDRGRRDTHNETNQQSNVAQERTNRFISNTTSSDSDTRSPAASLIQSAARSILDNDTATPSTTVSDDASENFSCADGTLGSRGHFAPSLNSLRHTTMTKIIPEESDRKCFVGCLAAVLASSYDYDENDEGATPEENSRDPYYYIDLEDDSFDESEDYPRSESAETRKYDQNRSDDMVSGRALSPSSRRQYYRQQRSESVSTTSMWRTNQPNKHVVAARRHRQRRYDVLSRLLISSSELLLLEKGVAKAFLPMLAPVLVPQPNRDRPMTPEINSFDDDNLDLGHRYLPRNIDEDDVLRPFLESLCTCSG